MQTKSAEVLEQLQLERIEDTLFRGISRDIGTRSVFGGQVLGQALSAAQRTVEPSRHAHSLHAYFLRAGDTEHPIVYSVDNTRDGSSFSVRRVTAIQHGQPIFVASASFHTPSPGPVHQMPAPQVPAPEDLPQKIPLSPEALAKLPDKTQRWLNGRGAFEFLPVQPRDELNPEKRPPQQAMWFRFADHIDDDPTMHTALLAYASDFFLVGTALLPHGFSYTQPNLRMASLDHAMWFHRPFRVDDWLLYACESPTMQDSRALARGSIYTRDGVLVASTAQEGMIRVTDWAG